MIKSNLAYIVNNNYHQKTIIKNHCCQNNISTLPWTEKKNLNGSSINDFKNYYKIFLKYDPSRSGYKSIEGKYYF